MAPQLCRERIIELCKEYNLPLQVRSTAIRIYNKAYKHLSHIQSTTLIHLILIVSAKCEEVRDFNIKSSTNILQYESALLTLIDYEMYYMSPYTILYGEIVQAQIHKKGYDVEEMWKKGCAIIDRRLVEEKEVDPRKIAYDVINK